MDREAGALRQRSQQHGKRNADEKQQGEDVEEVVEGHHQRLFRNDAGGELKFQRECLRRAAVVMEEALQPRRAGGQRSA